MTNLVSSCAASLCQINRIKYDLDRQTLITIIKALVFSKLYYCSSVWANSPKRNLKKNSMRSKFCCWHHHWHKKARAYLASITGAKLATDSSCCSVQWYCHGLKCVKSLAPLYLCKKFRKRSDVHSLATRNSNLLNIPSFKSAPGQWSFHYRATKLWIALPDEVKDLELDPFKQNFRVCFGRIFNFYFL